MASPLDTISLDIVSWTLNNLDYDQERPLFIDPSNTSNFLSAASSRTTIRRIIAGLKYYGLQKGDCVCVTAFNDIYYTCLYLGIIGAGGIFSGANPGYTAFELGHHVRITNAKFIISDLRSLAAASAAAKECGVPSSNIFVFAQNNDGSEDEAAGYKSTTCLMDCGQEDWVSVEDPNETTAVYFSTSGTSGLPKAAEVTHSYLVHQGEIVVALSDLLHPGTQLITTPPFHAYTAPLQNSLALRIGLPTYIMPRFHQDTFIRALQEHSITRFAAVPPILMSLSENASKENLSSVRLIYTAGANCSDSIQQALYEKLPQKARIENVYGMSEVGWALSWQESRRDDSGSVGSPVPGAAARLMDEEGNLVTEDGEHGELQILMPHPMKGYRNNSAATAEAFTTDGWVRTGDVGCVRNSKWYIVDRIKDMIKVRGWQVSPVEIEETIRLHPGVLDAAVTGVPADDDSGEVPHAFINKKDESLTEEDVKVFLGVRLAKYKEVEAVTFVSSIPKSATGKILRRELKIV